MKINLKTDAMTVGVETAKKYSTVYRLDQNNNNLMVVEEVNALHLSGRAFHMGVVIICICRTGQMSFKMGVHRHHFGKGGLFVNFGDSFISEVEMTDDFSATAIVVSHDFLQESIMSLMHLWPYLLYIMEHPILNLGEVEMQRLVMNYRLIIDRLSQDDHNFRREATIANVQACYLDVCDFLSKRVPQHSRLQTRCYAIFDHFVRLVASHYVEHRDVQWYADEMQITPKYLSEVVKEVSGRTASQWITNFVITELKSLLRNSDLSIKEIAVEMNFANQSFLGKYFKNIVGISPMEFRTGE